MNINKSSDTVSDAIRKSQIVSNGHSNIYNNIMTYQMPKDKGDHLKKGMADGYVNSMSSNK
jgi:hypothetical protein